MVSWAATGGAIGARRHLVDTAGMEGMATPQALGGKPATARGAVHGNGLHGVFRTAGHETAARSQQWADEALVEAEQGDEQA